MEAEFANDGKHWLHSPWKFRWYLLRHLPSLAFWGVSLKELKPACCRIKLPFHWQTQNPFGSIYFSALSWAAELSTGILLLRHLDEKCSVSMLVTEVQMEFLKKASTDSEFSCLDGRVIRESLQSLALPGDQVVLKLHATGQNASGETIARAVFTWSVKRR